MKDIPAYLKDSYLKDLSTEVVNVKTVSGMSALFLADTIFFPEGGGQPCDQGVISWDGGEMKVSEVKLIDGEIAHLGEVESEIEAGTKVSLAIDWKRRYKNMQVHTAGHLLDEALYLLGISLDGLRPVKASHSPRDSYILYTGSIDELPKDIKTLLTSEMDRLRSEALEIKTEFVTKESIKEKARVVPGNLPEGKPLRVVSFGDTKGIPDGGTMVKNTSEIPPVAVGEIEVVDDKVKISYKVDFGETTKEEPHAVQHGDVEFPEISRVSEAMKKDLEGKKLMSAAELRRKYLGKKGLIKDLFKEIDSRAKEDRADFGRVLNNLKVECEEKIARIEEKEAREDFGKAISGGSFDVTAPFAPNTPPSDRVWSQKRLGTLHPITEIGEKAINIFKTMGFHLTEARHLDDDYHTFESLNFPIGHPARDMFDTFWTTDDLLPITHTSSMQHRILKSNPIPIKEIIVGRCYRNEATDARHEHTFYHLEGMYVAKNVTVANLIGVLSEFMDTFYGHSVKYKIQPCFYPFVEPGLEFLIECLVCGQAGCPFCGRSGWIEVIPCGMIHPAVLREAGVDPKVYSGFAWGLGYDRLIMLRSQIDDIRNIHNGDLKFLEQFT